MSAAANALDVLQQAEEADAGFAAPHRKVLSFAVARETFALPIDLIKEIIEFGSVTRVPMTPPHVRGVLNLRGSVVPVIDLAARLGKANIQPDKRTCIIVMALPGDDAPVDIGVVVDAVNEVLDIPEEEIEPAPGFGASVRADFIDGMAKVRGRFVVVLEPATTFGLEELAGLAAELGR